MRSWHIGVAGAAALLAALCSPARAQDGQFLGEVTADRVFVRSGPNRTAYACTTVSRGDRVHVVGKVGGWLRILPVRGCYSVVSKSDGRYNAARGTAVITAETAWVRPGGNLCTDEFPGLQGRIARGATVKVIGRTRNYYKIKSPRKAYFWISNAYVRPAPGAASPPRTPGAGTTRPAATTRRAPTTAPAASPAARAIKAIDEELEAELDKPLDQRDLEGLIRKYRQVELPDDSPLRPHVAYRIEFLTTAAQHRRQRQAVQDLLRRTAEKQEEFEKQRARIDVASARVRAAPTYAARGLLVASEIYDDRFVVRDTETRAIVAYARCRSGNVNLADYVGKLVGILGAEVPGRAAGDLIEVEHVEVLADEASVPAPPRPTAKYVAPPPPPEPVPTTAPATRPADEPNAAARTEAAPAPEAKILISPDHAGGGSPIDPNATLQLPEALPEAPPAPRTGRPIEPELRVDLPTTRPAEAADAPTTTQPATAPTQPATAPARPTTAPAAPMKVLDLLPDTGLPMAAGDEDNDGVDVREYE
jgi:uncharacterized protein YgiM (DUF1202 family)